MENEKNEANKNERLDLSSLCDVARLQQLHNEMADKGSELSRAATDFAARIARFTSDLSLPTIPPEVPRLQLKTYQYLKYYEVSLPEVTHQYGRRYLSIAVYPARKSCGDVLRIESFVIQTPEITDVSQNYFFAIEKLQSAVEYLDIGCPVHAQNNLDKRAIGVEAERIRFQFCTSHMAPEVEVLIPIAARSWRLEVGSSIAADLVFSRVVELGNEEKNR